MTRLRGKALPSSMECTPTEFTEGVSEKCCCWNKNRGKVNVAGTVIDVWDTRIEDQKGFDRLSCRRNMVLLLGGSTLVLGVVYALRDDILSYVYRMILEPIAFGAALRYRGGLILGIGTSEDRLPKWRARRCRTRRCSSRSARPITTLLVARSRVRFLC